MPSEVPSMQPTMISKLSAWAAFQQFDSFGQAARFVELDIDPLIF